MRNRLIHAYFDIDLDVAWDTEYGMRHRRKRHHESGLEQVRKIFGDEAVEAARQHIIMDLKMEGWTENDPFPKKEQHYVQLGLF